MRPPKSVLEQTAGQRTRRSLRRAMQALFPDRDRPIDLHENPDGTFSARPPTTTQGEMT